MHSIPFKLKKSAEEFQAGEYTGFGIRTGVKHNKKGQDVWTNYKASIFSKSPAQIEFFRANLIEGAMVVVTAANLEVETFQGQNGLMTAINMINANVVAVQTPRAPDAAQQAYSAGMAAPRQVQQAAPAVQAPPAGFDSFDDDIPF